MESLLLQKTGIMFLFSKALEITMKTTLNLPDDVMIAVKVRAARENRKMKDIIADALRRDFGLAETYRRCSVLEIEPVHAGEVIPSSEPEDRLEDLLDARGHRYWFSGVARGLVCPARGPLDCRALRALPLPTPREGGDVLAALLAERDEGR